MALHTNIEYPVIGGHVPRLRDIRVVVHDTDVIPEDSALFIAVESNVVVLYVDAEKWADLFGLGVVAAGTYVVEASGMSITVTVNGPETSSTDVDPLPVEPCTIVWLANNSQAAFVSSLETVTGMRIAPEPGADPVEMKVGSGLSVEGSLDRVFRGDPTSLEYPSPEGLLMLNGHSTSSVPIRASRSVSMDVINDNEGLTIPTGEGSVVLPSPVMLIRKAVEDEP